MKVAFTYNLRLTDVRETEKEAEYDSAETVSAIAAALESAGHEVEKIEVSGPASNLLERLEQIDPDIIFNTAEGRGGKMREAFFPTLFEELGAHILFDRVAVQPGKPTWHARFGDGRLVLGLPGNPASAFVCAWLFVKPLLDQLCGRDQVDGHPQGELRDPGRG